MKAAIFDIDGTLIDSVDLHAKAWQEAFAHFGHPIPLPDVRAQIGKGGDQLIPVFLRPGEVRSQGKELEAYRTELYHREYFSQVTAFPRVRELFQRLLQDGWRVALASSAKGEELQRYKDLARIGDLLETETSSDDAAKSKPFPDIFQAALGRLQLPPEECLVVGDTPYDAEAAAKAGIRAVGFLSGGFPPEGLKSAGCVELYADPADALARYEGSIFHRERPDGG